MKSLALILLFLVIPLTVQAGNCPEGMSSCGWGDPEEIYAYTSRVLKAIEDRDLDELRGFMREGELKDGPRKSYMEGKEFSDLFSEDLRQHLLDTGPQCDGVGWRGIMLGSGTIWISMDKQGYYIFIMRADKEEVFSTEGLPLEWKVDGQSLTPDCFFWTWLSGDNFEEYEFYIHKSAYQEYGINIGLRLSEIPPTITEPSWCGGKNGHCDESDALTMIPSVMECTRGYPEPEIGGRWVEYHLENDHDFRYSILDGITAEQCQALVPGYPAKCLEAYLLAISVVGMGTMSPGGHTLYGLFEEADGNKVIAPLVFFRNENYARNFIEDLRAQ